MSVELVSILVLCAVFLLATTFPIHMGALAIAAAFVLGMLVLPGDFDAKVDQIAARFSRRLVRRSRRSHLPVRHCQEQWHGRLVGACGDAVGPRSCGAMPWVMFFVTAALSAVGAAAPGAVAMIAPIGIGFACGTR